MKFIYYNKNNIVINMQRLFKLNSVLQKKYVYNNLVLYKLILYKFILNQNKKPFFDEDYVIVEDTIKTNDKNIEDDWVEINNENYDVK
jgi:hypothetical protein